MSHNINVFLRTALCSLALWLPWVAQAQHNSHGSSAPAASHAMAPAMSEGEVRRVDAANGKITLKHGFIAHLDMPPMTMVFTVKAPALLAQVKVGDQVRFMVVKEDGVFLITQMQAAP